MDEKKRIGIITFFIILLQYVVSYIAYTNLSDKNVYLKLLLILFINWIIVGGGLLIVFKSYNSLYKGFRGLYSKYQMNIILYDLLKKLAGLEESEEVYNLILEAATKAIPHGKFGSIIMSHYGKLTFKASIGFDHEYLQLIELNIQETALYRLTNGKMDRPIIIPEILNIDIALMEESKLDLFKKAGVDKVRSSMAVPIVINNSVVGSINLDSDQVNVFDENDLEALDMFALEIGKFVHLHQILELNRNMSRYDELTKIYNRGYCTQKIKELMGNTEEFVIASLDINNLKEINDLYGHDIGDVMIKGFVNNVKLFLPDNVIFSRYGGDEFVIVFPGYTYTEVAVVLDDTTKFFEHFLLKDCDFPISITFCYGIGQYPLETEDYDELLKLADDRMYRQKRIYKEKVGRA